MPRPLPSCGYMEGSCELTVSVLSAMGGSGATRPPTRLLRSTPLRWQRINRGTPLRAACTTELRVCARGVATVLRRAALILVAPRLTTVVVHTACISRVCETCAAERTAGQASNVVAVSRCKGAIREVMRSNRWLEALQDTGEREGVNVWAREGRV
jgi:hypothetical protein